MSRFARLKTIFKDSKPIEVVSDPLDINSVDSPNLVDQSVTPEKVEDDSLTFEKMTADTKFITTNNAICALRDVGGISIGEDIDSMSIRDILKEIVIPYTKPVIGLVGYNVNSSSQLVSGYTITGSTITITSLTVPVMIKSENILSVKLDIIVNDSVNIYTNQQSASPIMGFQPNIFKNFTFSPTIQFTGTNVKDVVTFKVTVTDSNGGVTIRDSEKITMLPYLYFGNSNVLSPNLSALDIFNELNTTYISSSVYNDYGTNVPISHTFAKPINNYSFILIPTISQTIPSAIDQNGFMQNIDYVGNIIIKLNNVSVNYRLFRTGVSTMIDTLPNYTFKILSE